MTYDLAIIVPYRDRAEHLDQFIPHMIDFFSISPLTIGGRNLIKIIQQEQGREFNRGVLKNIGFILAQEFALTTCFHDVDFLPINVDYSPPGGEVWAALVGGGFEQLSTDGITIKQPAQVFGGAVIFDNSAFRKINGFSNSYWGWGYEDTDIAMRTMLKSIPFVRRSGTFKLLPHKNEGFNVDSARNVTLTHAHLKNKAIFMERFPPSADDATLQSTSKQNEDGLSSIKFEILDQRRVVESNKECCEVDIVTVAI